MDGGIVALGVRLQYKSNLIKNEQTGILQRRVEKLARKTLISENTMTLKTQLIAYKLFEIA